MIKSLITEVSVSTSVMVDLFYCVNLPYHANQSLSTRWNTQWFDNTKSWLVLILLNKKPSCVTKCPTKLFDNHSHFHDFSHVYHLSKNVNSALCVRYYLYWENSSWAPTFKKGAHAQMYCHKKCSHILIVSLAHLSWEIWASSGEQYYKLG